MLRVTDRQYWMEKKLKRVLDTMSYNLQFDWDFVICITGSGMVRIGKSVLAQQIGYYVAKDVGTPFSLKNVVFDAQELVELAHKIPKNSVIIYDEARESLDAKKTLARITKTLLDFFAECGMYNHFIILVLPDFFELNRRMAITRTQALLNVFRHHEKKMKNGEEVLKYKRGYFEFYGRGNKKKLYIEGKKLNDTYIAKYRDFWGEFREHWILDRKVYERKKLEFLRRSRFEDSKPMCPPIVMHQRDWLVRYIVNELDVSAYKLDKDMTKGNVRMSKQHIGRILKEKLVIRPITPLVTIN